jgi:ABC-2 type transport system ATP-binding protein
MIPEPELAGYSVVAEALTRRFGDLLAVDNLSLHVREGEFFGFLGPNGAGKSTTIKMLCGLLRPSAGLIRVAGRDVQKEPLEVKRVIGVLPEEPQLYDRLTGEEFLHFAGRMYGLPLDETRARAADLLQVLDLASARHKMIVDYSMGMRKKAALAAALIHRPKVLFLDEPFNGIDPVSVRAIRGILRQLTDRGTTILFSSHVMEVVANLCTRVAILNRGRLVGQGTLDELRASAAAEGGASLEDVFLQMIEARADPEALSWL